MANKSEEWKHAGLPSLGSIVFHWLSIGLFWLVCFGPLLYLHCSLCLHSTFLDHQLFVLIWLPIVFSGFTIVSLCLPIAFFAWVRVYFRLHGLCFTVLGSPIGVLLFSASIQFFALALLMFCLSSSKAKAKPMQSSSKAEAKLKHSQSKPKATLQHS